MSTEIQTGKLPAAVNRQKTTSSTGQNTNPAATNAERNSQIGEQKNDTVSMTDQVGLLQKVEKQIAAIPTVNSAKVAEVKQAIADGSFKIDTDSTANKIIEMESGILNNDTEK